MRLIDASAIASTEPSATSATTQPTIQLMVGASSARRGSAPEELPELAQLLLELPIRALQAEEIDEQPHPYRGVGREQVREVRHAAPPRASASRRSTAASSDSRPLSDRRRMSHPASSRIATDDTR